MKAAPSQQKAGKKGRPKLRPKLRLKIADLVRLSSQVCPKPVPSHLAETLMQASNSPVDMVTLMAPARHTNRTRFRKAVLQPLIDANLMEPTIPDKPRSSKQQYRLTELGRQLLEQQRKEQS